jgi:tRNA 2-thiouridine synthesizing protein E
MQELNKTFNDIFGASTYDRPFNLEALGPWSNNIAIELAAKEGITMTPAHWEVIDALRNHYQEYGPDSTARSLLQCLESEFADRGGKKYLYDLFPRGPINQACRIAGLPLPPHSSDPSFGSVM